MLGSRSSEKGRLALEALAKRDLKRDVEVFDIDVTNDSTIQAAVAFVKEKHGRLDILVNNAAVAAMDLSLRQSMRDAFDTNATGPAVVTDLFGPLLKSSTNSPYIINISSGAGSINQRLDPTSRIYKLQAVQYRSSKAALSMVTACQFYEYEPLGVKVFAFCPGFTQSNLSADNTAQKGAKAPADAVMPIIDIMEGKRDDEVGGFLHSTGTYPW